MGVHSPAAAGQQVQQLRYVGQRGGAHVQNPQPHRAGQAVGHAEKPHEHDVRETVASAALLLQDEHHQEGARKTTYLQVSSNKTHLLHSSKFK